MIKPAHLVVGDLVGVAAPAGSYAPTEHALVERGLAGLEQLGLRVQVAPNARAYRPHRTVSCQQRAEDINILFADPAIKAIICLVGGSHAHAVLPYLDWATIRRSPKIVMGYSAITALLVALTTRADLVTFHGPMIMDGFSEFPSLLPFTQQQVEHILFKGVAPFTLQQPSAWTQDFPRSDEPRQMRPNAGWQWLRGGYGQGRLIGGNLTTLRTLVGTPYWPSFTQRLLAVEEVNMGQGVLYWIEDSLAHLQQLGVFDQINGLVFGKINDLSDEEEYILFEIVRECTLGTAFPILMQVDFGHTDPRLILPFGALASLDSTLQQFQLEEAAVSLA